MPRSFDGNNDEIRVAIGNCNITGAITMAVVFRRNSVAYSALMALHNSGGTATYALEVEDSAGGNQIDFTGITNWPDVGGGLAPVIADNWQLVGANKAAGTTTPRGHQYVYSAGVWKHSNAGSTLADRASVTGGTVRFGEWQDVDDFAGDIAIAAIWNRSLSDAEWEMLPYDLNAWYALGPVGLWIFDAGIAAMSLADLTGGGANSSGTGGTITGTAVSIVGPPPIHYGADGLQILYPATSTPASATGAATLNGLNASSAAVQTHSASGTPTLPGLNASGAALRKPFITNVTPDNVFSDDSVVIDGVGFE